MSSQRSPSKSSYTYRIEHIPRNITKDGVKEIFGKAFRPSISVDSFSTSVDCPETDDGDDTRTYVATCWSNISLIPSISSDIGVDKSFNGFTPLYCPNERQGPIKADIIAVTGLAGHAFGSWAHSRDRMWLRDYLPKDVPNVRVLTWGYPSQLQGSQGQSSIMDYALGLATRLSDMRKYTNCQNRPIIFVGHSLGGLIIKAALIELQASATKETQFPVCGMVFLGTPHKGLDVAAISKLVRGMPSEKLIQELTPDSPTLRRLNRDFRRYEGVPILSIYERESTRQVIEVNEEWQRKGDFHIAVPRDSATLDWKEERQIQADGNHSEIAKIIRGEGSIYPFIRDAIREAVSLIKPARPPIPISASDSVLVKAILSHEISQVRNYAKNPMLRENRVLSHFNATPLGLAAYYGLQEAALQLLQAGVNVEAVDINHHTPLVVAILSNYPKMVALLIDYGAIINSSWRFSCSPRDPPKQYSPLMTAALLGRSEVVSILIDRGANVNFQSSRGITAVRIASSQGNLITVKRLVEAGAILDQDGCYSPLPKAAEGGHLEIVKYLISHGAECDTVYYHENPLIMAAKNGHFDVCSALIDGGARLDVRSQNSGYTVLMIAILGNRRSAVDMLLSKGVQSTFHIYNYGGLTALNLAASIGNVKIVKSLLQAKAPMELADRDKNWTALHCASNFGHLDIAHVLIRAGANATVTDSNGDTPLRIAEKAGNQAMSELLNTSFK